MFCGGGWRGYARKGGEAVGEGLRHLKNGLAIVEMLLCGRFLYANEFIYRLNNSLLRDTL